VCWVSHLRRFPACSPPCTAVRSSGAAGSGSIANGVPCRNQEPVDRQAHPARGSLRVLGSVTKRGHPSRRPVSGCTSSPHCDNQRHSHTARGYLRAVAATCRWLVSAAGVFESIRFFSDFQPSCNAVDSHPDVLARSAHSPACRRTACVLLGDGRSAAWLAACC
jgi:hypothetical protein